MKIKSLYLIIALAAISFLSLTAYKSVNKSLSAYFSKAVFGITESKDVIKFNHAKHLKDAGLGCKDCHGNALNSVNSTDNLNPTKKQCESCHDVKDTKECGLCHYDGVYKKLTPVNKGLIFSHKMHAASDKDCQLCHKGLDKVKYASDSPEGYPNMESCYSCHNGVKAVQNCEACHTNLTNLKPKDHFNSNFLNEHKLIYDASTGMKNDNCMMCHSTNFCENCHQPVKYSGNNKPTDFYAPYYTKDQATRTDRHNLQKLTNAHSLNYVNTHGLDARQKSFECKTCHEPESFCSGCHTNGGNKPTGIAPASHLQSNFATFGVNTGGGLHATLARRDIETCESCHSIGGGDPICVKCHYDNDGIKGTNPKTHENGFMHDERGNWHDTKASVCYSCHVDPNARPNGMSGIGFCGYCHPKK